MIGDDQDERPSGGTPPEARFLSAQHSANVGEEGGNTPGTEPMPADPDYSSGVSSYSDSYTSSGDEQEKSPETPGTEPMPADPDSYAGGSSHSDSYTSSDDEEDKLVSLNDLEAPRKLFGEGQCPICREPCNPPALIDGCFHVYCLPCILQWGAKILCLFFFCFISSSLSFSLLSLSLPLPFLLLSSILSLSCTEVKKVAVVSHRLVSDTTFPQYFVRSHNRDLSPGCVCWFCVWPHIPFPCSVSDSF